MGRIPQADGEGQAHVAAAPGPLKPEHDAVAVEPQRIHARDALQQPRVDQLRQHVVEYFSR